VNPRRSLLSDAWGGFAATLVALPAAIAYGVAVYSILGIAYVGQGIRAGIVGAIIVGGISAAIGGAPRLISAPSAPAAAVLASVAAGLVAGGSASDPGRAMVLLGLIAGIAGLLQVVFGAVGGGRLIKFIPFPVVAGYLGAVAVMIFLSQVPKFLGIAAKTSFGHALLTPHLWQWPAIVVGGVTIAAMLLTPRLTKRVPASIIALAAGTSAYFTLGLANARLWQLSGNTLLIGPLSGENLFSLERLRELTTGLASMTAADLRFAGWAALTLATLLAVDSLKTCVVVDALTFSRHNSNRTLLGQGLANALSAALGGMPGSGTMGATLVNSESGGRTRMSGLFEAGFVLVAVLLLGRWLAWVPLAALAGILIVVAWRMFDWNAIHLLRQRSTILDFFVIATVVVVAVATNLIAAAGAGVALAIVLFIRDQIRGSVIRRKTHGDCTFSKQPRLPDEQAVLEQHGRQTTVCELQGSLFFGTTDQLYRELEPDLATCRYLILDLRRVQALDYTATHLFEQFEAMLAPRHGWVIFSRLPPRRELRDYLSAQAQVDPARNARTAETLDDALQWAEDQILSEQLPRRQQDAAPMALGEFDLLRDLEHDPGLAALASCARERTLTAGETLFESGDSSDSLFLVRQGTIRVVLPLNGHGYHTLATFGRGHFFGEMAFLARSTRSATAVATTTASLYAVSRSEFDVVARSNPVVAVKIFARLARTLAERLRRADAELRALYDA
jgi:SulP family sulfate permease